MGDHEGCGFPSPILATRTRVLNFGTEMSVQPYGVWTAPRSTNLPSRFYESHSSGVPFGICISGSSGKEVKEVHSYRAWPGLLGVDSAPVKPTPAHNSRDRLRDLTRYGGTILRA